jgi:hypothetical protein
MSTYIQMFCTGTEGTVSFARRPVEGVLVVYDTLTVTVNHNGSTEEVTLFLDPPAMSRLKEVLMTDERKDNTVEADTSTQPV